MAWHSYLTPVCREIVSKISNVKSCCVLSCLRFLDQRIQTRCSTVTPHISEHKKLRRKALENRKSFVNEKCPSVFYLDIYTISHRIPLKIANTIIIAAL